jgi:hypothetical protein
MFGIPTRNTAPLTLIATHQLLIPHDIPRNRIDAGPPGIMFRFTDHKRCRTPTRDHEIRVGMSIVN